MPVEFLPITSRAQWLQWRRQVLTGSDIAALSGLDEYRSPLAVYIEKTQGLEIPDNNLMRRGRWLEPAALKALREKQPTWDIRAARIFLRDRERRLGGTPDAVATRPDVPGTGIVEAKTVAQRVFDTNWSEGPPLRYQLQTLLYAGLADASWAVVCALVISEFGAEMEIFPVDLIPEAFGRIVREAASFWQSVERGEEPPLRPDIDRDLVRAIYPRPKSDGQSPKDLSADNTLPGLLAERAVLTAQLKKAHDRKDEIDTMVMAAMGDASDGTLPDWKIMWRLEQRAGYTVPASERRALRIYPRRE